MITLQERVHGTPPPSAWALGKLHRVLRVRRHFKNLGMQENNLLSLSYGRIVRRDIDTAEGLLPESFETYQIVEPGNIVMRLTDLQNDKRSLRQALVHERGIITSAYDALEVGSGHDPRFWSYALLALDLAKYYYSLGGGVRQSINFADFPNDWIAIPDYSVQKSIADFLDREARKLDQIIERKQRMAKLLAERRRMVALAGMADGLSGFSWEPSQHSVAFQFKQPGWSAMRVKRLVSFMTSGSRAWSGLLGIEGEAFIQSGNIGRQMEVDLNTVQRVQPQVGAEAERTLVKGRDVLVCITGGRTGAVGYVRSIEERAYINQHVCLLRARDRIIDSELLAQILWSEIGQKQIALCQYGVKQGVGFNEVANLLIPIPPRAVQQKLVANIGLQTSKLDRLSNAINVSVERLNETRSALITAAVSGRINVQSWKKRGTTHRLIDAIQAEGGR